MKFHKCIVVLLLTICTNDLYCQKVRCDLIEIASRAFDKDPNIKRSYYTIQNAEANLQLQRSVFDLNSFSELGIQNTHYTLLNADPRISYIEDKILKTNIVNFSAGLRRKFRTGQTTELSLNYGFDNSNYPINIFNQLVGNYLGNHASTINFSLTQPLLRGKGLNIATALEKTYGLYIENSKNNNEYTNSYELSQIGVAYWNYYTAFKSLEIYKQNESRVRNVLEITKELVKADKKPVSDLVPVNADLANQEKLTIMGEQALYEARLNLGRVIGLSNDESLLVDSPTSDFPTVSESAYKENLDLGAFIRVAKEKRADLKAARKIYEALEKQYQLAINGIKPQLDLIGFVSYGSASTGNGVNEIFSSFSNNQGKNIGTGAKLSFTFPLNNNLAKGNLAKGNIALNDQRVVNDNLQRNIELTISNDLNYLNNSVLNLRKAEEALQYNKETFNNEQIKFQTGLTTILNLIIFQERLTTSELKYLQAYQQFAIAVINIRHDTGTLIFPDDKGFSIDRKAFYTIPDTNNY